MTFRVPSCFAAAISALMSSAACAKRGSVALAATAVAVVRSVRRFMLETLVLALEGMSGCWTRQTAGRGGGTNPPPQVLENQAALQHADDVILAVAGGAVAGTARHVQQMRIAAGGADIDVLVLPGRADGGAEDLGIR